MRIAITGANGFLGGHLVDAALARGHEVVGAVRRPHELAEREGCRWVHGDLGDPASLEAAFSGCDAVVANAALAPGRQGASAEAFYEANVKGARAQVEAAADAGVARVVYVSTVAVYRTRLMRAMGEASPRFDPLHRGFDWNQLTTHPEYATSKAAAEIAVWEASARRGTALTALRAGPLYGPGDHKMVARYVDRLTRRVPSAPTVAVPHLHGRDAADAAIASAERPQTAGRAYNLAGPSVSVWRAVRALGRELGRGPVVPLPVPLRVAFDDRAARRDLSFTPRGVTTGMRDTAAWWAVQRPGDVRR